MSNSASNGKQNSNVVTSESPAKLELTAYQGGSAVFREKRVVALVAGRNRVFLAGLPAQFDPNSLTVVSVEGKGQFKMGPVSHRPANLNTAAILAASVDQSITLIEQTPQGQVRTSGILRHLLGNQAVLEQQDGHLLVLQVTPKFELSGALPAGLSALSSLLMEPTVSEAGDFGINVLYEADGLGWTPRYEAFYDAAAERLTRFACYVDLTNNTGRKLEDAVFKLIAATNLNVRRSRNAGGGIRPMAMSASLESAPAADFSAESASVESVGESKMYVLPEALTLDNGESKQTALVFAENVPVRPEYFITPGYYGDATAKAEDAPKLPVSIRLRLKNDRASNLGAALPPAEVRVLEPDSSGALQKTDTTAVVLHVSTDEAFTLNLRNPCRDLKAARRLTFLHQDPEPVEQPETGDQVGTIRPQGGPGVGTPEAGSRRRREVAESAGTQEKKPAPRFQEEERELTLFNYKDKEVEVVVTESFPHNAEVLKNSHEFAPSIPGSGTVTLKVPAKGSATLTYRVKFRIN